jgi:hypothetical protein
MKIANIPHYLKNHRGADLIIVFDDGDRYPASVLDLVGERDDGKFEIYVAFEHCRGQSQACARAEDAGSPEKYPGSWWTSTKPSRPVAMSYTLERINSIYDNDAGYNVYDKIPNATDDIQI